MKRILAFLLIAVIVLPLASCGMPKTPGEAIAILVEEGCDAREYESSYLLSTVGIARADISSMVCGDDGNNYGCVVFFCVSDDAAVRVEAALNSALLNATTVSVAELALGFKEMSTYKIKSSASVVAIGHERLISAL